MARPVARHRTAYDVGRRGEAVPDWVTDADTLAAYDRGLQAYTAAGDTPPAPAGRRSSTATATRTAAAPAAPAAPALPPSNAPAPPAAPSPAAGGRGLPSITLTTGSRAGDDAAGLLAGLVVYALVLSYIRQGPAGPAAWIKAKFVNRGPDGSYLP